MNRWLFVVYLTTCLLTGLAPLAFAQTTTTLAGTVADATTGKGMPFANVYVNGSTRGTLTNEQGHYSLTGVPLGTVEIVASSVGYQPQRRTIRLEANQNSKAQFRLKPSEQTLLTVTVHGNQKNGNGISSSLNGNASVQREFYLPKYTAETQLTDRIDRRDVLYWKPLMQTDSQGHSQLIFPLSDVVRTIRVTLQGITETGRPIAVTKLIHVQ